MVSICAWWSDIIDGESVSAVDFVSEHGDILDVTEADVDIAPEAADGFIEGEGGGAGDEHQRFDGAVDEFDDLAALGFVPGFFHERELAAGEGDVIEGADGGHEQHAGGVEFGRDTTTVVQDDAGFGEIGRAEGRESVWQDV